MRVRVTRRVKFNPNGYGYGWPLPDGYIPVAIPSEDSLCPRKQPDVSGPGLGEAGRYRMVSEPTLAVSRARTGVSAEA